MKFYVCTIYNAKKTRGILYTNVLNVAVADVCGKTMRNEGILGSAKVCSNSVFSNVSSCVFQVVKMTARLF